MYMWVQLWRAYAKEKISLEDPLPAKFPESLLLCEEDHPLFRLAVNERILLQGWKTEVP